MVRKIALGSSGLSVPTVAVGCMRLNKVSKDVATQVLNTALEAGANFFDHADIYGAGECESIFADLLPMHDDVRETLILQSKCGIRKGISFDFSKAHILASVDGILQRLKTDYLDVLLLHRPDALMEPEDVAEAFDVLHGNGKVRHFGVSNQNPAQIRLLQKYVKQPLVANQLQLSIMNASMITQGLHINMNEDVSVDRDGSILDFCRLNDMTIQAWSPFQYGFFEGVFIDNAKFPELNKKLAEIGESYGVSKTTIAMAWLLRHPAKIQPVTGTMNPGRLQECLKATEITLSREEWYAIYLAAGYTLP